MKEKRKLDVGESSKSHTEKTGELPETEPRRSKRPRIEKNFGDDFYTFLIEDDPLTYTEAMRSSDASLWEEAVKSEMDSILSHNTWVLTDLPPGSRPIGCKWIFKRKRNPDGSIEKYKARLVAKGYSQKEGIDFFDTYSPVTRITTVRVLIALAASYKLEIHQMDVKTAFLNGELDEEIYMEQPEGFVVPGQENKVCKLVKSLYGLKQAPRQWHEKFDKVILSYGFRICDFDKCVYWRVYKNSFIIMCLYVDDILIFGKEHVKILEVKNYLSDNFDMKELGLANVILEIRVIKDENEICLTQSHYVEKVLKQFGFENSKPVSTPYDSSVKLKKNGGDSVSQLRYSQIIGSLMYLSNCTRPDISYAVGRLSRYTSNPNKTHWSAIERLLRYLKGTVNYGIHYSGLPTVLEGYSDANWISDSDETKSTSGFVFTLGGGAVAWKSSKQTLITKSTMEAEMVALELAGGEAEWLRSLLSEIPLLDKPIPAILINCDNQATIMKVKSKNHNSKSSRHIELRYKILRKLTSTGIITLSYVKSMENLADHLTKGLSRGQVQFASRGMGLKPIT
ncbi:hypothetical protein H6P81_020222 [Aristolochia fimbriata]|uniref:Reverse transcriptase Ty1/copia-type domain-containing protein n=1 Tax=Aristolochia fimbriata TaxID=158543 RepID=A0AAV7DX35_ARIFI|nr:hypothetical protein H6P81_020222 [Aristolochia fimbriata]